MKENVDLIKEIGTLRLENKEASQKKGSEDEKKAKNEPKEEELRAEIKSKVELIDQKRREIEDLEERISSL